MILSVSLVVLLAVIVWLLVSRGGLKPWHAVVCVVLGFELAGSGLAPDISRTLRGVMSLIGRINL